MIFIYIGALTSSSTRYSYRTWECEKIESYDPFDTIGSSIVYSMYNNSIVKVGPAPTNNIDWCTDKVRHFIDGFKLASYTEAIIIHMSHHFQSTSWSECINYISMYLQLSSIFQYVNYVKVRNVYIYDMYLNGLELYSMFDFFKALRVGISLSIFMQKITKLYLYLGFYRIIHLERMYVSNFNFYCSLLDINYPYLYLLLTQNFVGVYIVGFQHKYHTVLNHINIGTIYFYYCRIFALIIEFYNIFDGFFLKNNNYVGYFYGGVKAVYGITCGIIISICYICMYSNIGFIKFAELYMWYYYIVLAPYSNYYLELIFKTYLSDQYYEHVYMYINSDCVGSSLFSKVSVLCSYFVLNYNCIYDLIIPICAYIGTGGFNIDCYANLSIYSKVLAQPSLFYFSNIIYLYLYINIPFIFVYIHSTTVNFGAYLFKYTLVYEVMGLVYTIYPYFNYLNSVVYYNNKYDCYVHNLKYKKYYLPYKVSSPIYIYPKIYYIYQFPNYYYVDLSTYFLTGACCRVSRFISRYRNNSGATHSNCL